MVNKKAVTLLSLCCALAACDGGTATRDPMAPEEPGAGPEASASLLAPSNTWASKRPMLAARVQAKAGARFNHNGASVNNGRLYVAGGQNSNGAQMKTLYVYTAGTDTWVRKADMPGDGATLTVYNPGTNTWATKASMPTARSSPAGAAASGLLFVIGGIGSNGNSSTKVEAYTP